MNDFPTIYGFNKYSEMGINLFAPSVFLGGCNLRCPYCINCDLVHMQNVTEVPIYEVKNYILENECKWLNISGGEPTCSDEVELINLFKEIKSWGCKIGMATNGTNSEVLQRLLVHLNYVALDIKTTDYSQYASINSSDKDALIEVMRSHINIVEEKKRRSSFDYEVRTTLYPPFINIKTLMEIGSIVKKEDTWVLQKFRNNGKMLDTKCKEIDPYTDDEIADFMISVNNMTEKAFLREI